MPAVHLERLKIQSNELMWQFTRPVEFQRGLEAILEYYGDRVYRAGFSMQNGQSLPSYHLPPIVLRQLEQDLKPRIQENPAAALVLADVLWKEEMAEMRHLASVIVGKIPSTGAQEVIAQLTRWSQNELGGRYTSMAMKEGSSRLRLEQQELWLNTLRDWLNGSDTTMRKSGLQALAGMADDHQFTNLPPLFQMIAGPLRDEPDVHASTLTEILTSLARRIPIETAHFLLQSVLLGISPATARLVRRVIPVFDDTTQSKLRAALQNSSSANKNNAEKQGGDGESPHTSMSDNPSKG